MPDKCTRCNGAGEDPWSNLCTWCNGTGELPQVPPLPDGACSECNGHGYIGINAYVINGEICGPDGVPCDACNGTGEAPPQQAAKAGE